MCVFVGVVQPLGTVEGAAWNRGSAS